MNLFLIQLNKESIHYGQNKRILFTFNFLNKIKISLLHKKLEDTIKSLSN
jgi:hypothetical protein